MTGSTLKIIAILSMLIDHIGYLLFPEVSWLRAVGRLAFPIFALSAAEGARFTHDRRAYLTRLLIWGLISEIPFDLMGNGVVFSLEAQNVCFTLAAGVACIYLLEKKDRWSMASVVIIIALTFFLNTDYSFVGVISVIIIHHFAKQDMRVKGVAIACLLLSLMFDRQYYCFLALLPIMLYKGKPGMRLKYLFYIFYPLHMLILWAVWAGGFLP